jgi:hypothetical protein
MVPCRRIARRDWRWLLFALGVAAAMQVMLLTGRPMDQDTNVWGDEKERLPRRHRSSKSHDSVTKFEARMPCEMEVFERHNE